MSSLSDLILKKAQGKKNELADVFQNPAAPLPPPRVAPAIVPRTSTAAASSSAASPAGRRPQSAESSRPVAQEEEQKPVYNNRRLQKKREAEYDSEDEEEEMRLTGQFHRQVPMRGPAPTPSTATGQISLSTNTFNSGQQKVDKNKDAHARTVFVGNLDTATNDRELRHVFGKYGAIESIRFRGVPLERAGKEPLSVAFLKKAFAFKKNQDNKTKKDTKNKPTDDDDEEDEEEKEESEDEKEEEEEEEPEEGKKKKKEIKTVANMMCAYVVYKDKEHAKAAVAGERGAGTVVHGRHIRVDLATPPASVTGGSTARKWPHERSVFVGNLPLDCDEEELRKHFEECGTIDSTRVVRNNDEKRTGKGIGFVTFTDAISVQTAVLKNGEKMRGRELRVTRSLNPTKASASVEKYKKQALREARWEKNKKGSASKKFPSKSFGARPSSAPARSSAAASAHGGFKKPFTKRPAIPQSKHWPMRKPQSTGAPAFKKQKK